jgi:nicotinamide-nucleotide amidase
MIIDTLSAEFGAFCKKHNLRVVTAESCTAGLISATIADTPGSSGWLDGGFSAYTAELKNQILDVSLDTIAHYDITSIQVAHEMVWGALKKTKANFALAVTGLAGPGGGTEEIPVGTVCMAWAHKVSDAKTNFVLEEKFFEGDRNQIRTQVVAYMLQQVMSNTSVLSTSKKVS